MYISFVGVLCNKIQIDGILGGDGKSPGAFPKVQPTPKSKQSTFL